MYEVDTFSKDFLWILTVIFDILLQTLLVVGHFQKLIFGWMVGHL